MPVPPLPLGILLETKNACEPVTQQTTGGSDRSCRIRAPLSSNLGLPSSPALHCPECVPTYGDDSARPASSKYVAEGSYPNSPHSMIDCTTPRTQLDISVLTLHSPESARQYRTPERTPRISPHSCQSPSMMSPLRMVGIKSPCSERIVGSHRISRGQVLPLASGDTMTSNSHHAAGPSAALCGSPRKSRRPFVQRSLPFSEKMKYLPGGDGASPSGQNKQQNKKLTSPKKHLQRRNPISDRFQVPSPHQARELSFSDLLCGAGRLPRQESPCRRLAPPLLDSPARNSNGQPSLPPSHPPNHGCPDSEAASTPRKRPRKSAAPQRAAFGSGDSGSMGLVIVDAAAVSQTAGSSHGETYGISGLDQEDTVAHTSPFTTWGPPHRE